MRILRKLFSKFKNMDPFKIPKEWFGKYNKIEVELEVDNEMWNKEMPLLVSEEAKNRARQYKKDIQDASNLFNNATDDPYEDTHILTQFSTNEKQVWSKKLTAWDRFNYEVYRPILDEVNRVVKFPVKIKNLFGHRYRGKNYSEKDIYFDLTRNI